jgi:teichuronic acid biosynthesis glycosyltransferase TuaC
MTLTVTNKKKIRALLFSTLYPSSVRPVHGIFVETRLRELLKSGEVETKVIAPVPWFPFKAKVFGEYAQFASTPEFEARNGVDVYHPRYFLPPKVGMNVAPYTLARAALPTIRKLIDGGYDFDLIDAHYYYPDGVAASFIAKALGKPFVVTARGTDLNLIPEYEKPRKLILETAERASASIGVCKALMDRLAELGADPVKLHTLRNGVDLERFKPVDRKYARQQLGLPADQRIFLSVGHLVERKGNHIAIEAMAKLCEGILLIAGSGPELGRLQQMATQLGVDNRVRFLGQIANDQLSTWYSAADALFLCSSREGWANVLLESMACGTPVVATDIWGTPEVVSSPTAGRLMSDRSATALIDSVRELLDNYPEQKDVRNFAENFSWEMTSRGQFELFQSILNNRTNPRAENDVSQ